MDMGIWRQLFYPESPGVYTTGTLEERAAATNPFQIPIVVACRQLVADTVASFPLLAKRDTEFLDPNRSILRRPNPSEPSSDTFERIVNAMTRYGGAWLRITQLGADGFPLSLEFVDTPRVNWTLNEAGDRIVAVEIDGKTQDVRRIRHVPFILDGGSPIGRSALREIDQALEDLNRANVYAADFYGAGATPPYAILSPTRLQKDQADKLLTGWTEARTKSRPAVLSGDLDLKTFTAQSAADALVQDAVQQLDATVARVMQVPPSLVNVLSQSSLTYSTVLDESRRWLALGLNTGYLSRIEATFTDLMPRGMYAKFDTTGLTELDQRAQLDFDIAAVEAGLLTANEVRASRGLTPIEETTDVATSVS